MRLFVTGFGPFEKVKENPSAWLAERLGPPHRVLDVSFEAVEAFLREFDPEPYDGLLMLGVHGRSRHLRLERYAQNRIARRKDVSGVVKAGKIDPGGPLRIQGGLWRGLPRPESRRLKFTGSAGSYLCNYAYYRALSELPHLKVGFLHVPQFKHVAAERQLDLIAEILRATR